MQKQCRRCKLYLNDESFGHKGAGRKDTECKVCNYTKKRKYTCDIPENMKQCKVCSNLKEKTYFGTSTSECMGCEAERKNIIFLEKLENKKTKQCKQCSIIYNLDEGFYTKGLQNNIINYSTLCKKCDNKNRYKKRRENPKEKIETERSLAVKEMNRELNKERNTALKLKKYGLDIDTLNLMIKNQSNKCYICNKPGEENVHGMLVVDHCHSRLKVRKLLCNHCNIILGMVKEDLNYIDKLKNYIIDHL